MHYRSRNVFSFGSRCLPASQTKIKAWYSGTQPNSFQLALTGLSPSTADHSRSLQLRWLGGGQAHNTTSPTGFPVGFGLNSSLFARCYLGNTYWFLFLPLLRCFHSGGSHSPEGVPQPKPWQEVPFGHPRIEGRMHLPGAYRGLLRPSSASEPSYSPDGVSYRFYSRAQRPISVRGQPLRGDHCEHTLTTPFVQEPSSRTAYPSFFSSILFWPSASIAP